MKASALHHVNFFCELYQPRSASQLAVMSPLASVRSSDSSVQPSRFRKRTRPYGWATLLRATELRESVVDIPPVHDAVVVVIRRWITAAESFKDLHDRDDRL